MVVSNSIATGNEANGFVALARTNAVSSRNGQTGVYSGALATVRISNVASIQNNVGLQSVGGGAIISFGNNRVHGNVGGDSAPTSTPGQLLHTEIAGPGPGAVSDARPTFRASTSPVHSRHGEADKEQWRDGPLHGSEPGQERARAGDPFP